MKTADDTFGGATDAPQDAVSAAPTAALGEPRGLSEATARVARTLLEVGSATATDLAGRLFLTPTAVRRHLDTLIERGLVSASDEPQFGPARGRRVPRPARAYYAVTAAGRDAFESSYDDVALAAIDFLAERLGDSAVDDFARARAASSAAATRPLPLPQTQRSASPSWPSCCRLTATSPAPRQAHTVCSCASTTAPWRTSPSATGSSARLSAPPSQSCWACMPRVWRPSPAAPVCARR